MTRKALVLILAGFIGSTEGLIAFWNTFSSTADIGKSLGLKSEENPYAYGGGLKYDAVIQSPYKSEVSEILYQAGFYDPTTVVRGYNGYYKYDKAEQVIKVSGEEIKLYSPNIIHLINLITMAVKGELKKNAATYPPLIIDGTKARYLIDIQRKKFPWNENYYFVLRPCPGYVVNREMILGAKQELKAEAGQALATTDQTEKINKIDALLNKMYFCTENTGRISAITFIPAGIGGGIAGGVGGAVFAIPFAAGISALIAKKYGKTNREAVAAGVAGAVAATAVAPVTIIAGFSGGIAQGSQAGAAAGAAATKSIGSKVTRAKLILDTDDKIAIAQMIEEKGGKKFHQKISEYGNYTYRTTFTCGGDTIYITTTFVKNEIDPSAIYPKRTESIDPSAVDSKTIDPSTIDPSAVDRTLIDPSAVDSNTIDPTEIDTNDLLSL